jgi:hypothetical protein
MGAGITTSLQKEDPGFLVRFLSLLKGSSLLKEVQTGSGALTAFYSMGTGDKTVGT